DTPPPRDGLAMTRKRTGQWLELGRLSFAGGRFVDGAIDLTALKELETFQNLVTEVAEAIWRRENPEKSKLPDHFLASTALFIRKVEKGSTVIPFEYLVEESTNQERLFTATRDEVPREL